MENEHLEFKWKLFYIHIRKMHFQTDSCIQSIVELHTVYFYFQNVCFVGIKPGLLHNALPTELQEHSYCQIFTDHSSKKTKTLSVNTHFFLEHFTKGEGT